MNKWQSKLKKCSCCIKVLAAIFMGISAWHMIGPAHHPPMHLRDGNGGREGRPKHGGNKNFNHEKDDHDEWGRHLSHSQAAF